MDASGWPVVATHLATHFTRRETNDGNGWRRLDIQKRRWNLARRDRHRARQGHRAQAAAHGPRQDQGGGEREAQDEAGRIRAQGLHAELAVAAPHGLAGDLVPRAGRGQPASEQQAKLRERHRAAEQDSRREAHQLAGPQGHGRHSGRPEVLQPEDSHDHLVRPEERA